MALIKCEDCEKEYSDKAEACPQCACPNSIKEKAIILQKLAETKKEQELKISTQKTVEVIKPNPKYVKNIICHNCKGQYGDRKENCPSCNFSTIETLNINSPKCSQCKESLLQKKGYICPACNHIVTKKEEDLYAINSKVTPQPPKSFFAKHWGKVLILVSIIILMLLASGKLADVAGFIGVVIILYIYAKGKAKSEIKYVKIIK